MQNRHTASCLQSDAVCINGWCLWQVVTSCDKVQEQRRVASLSVLDKRLRTEESVLSNLSLQLAVLFSVWQCMVFLCVSGTWVIQWGWDVGFAACADKCWHTGEAALPFKGEKRDYSATGVARWCGKTCAATSCDVLWCPVAFCTRQRLCAILVPARPCDSPLVQSPKLLLIQNLQITMV